MIEHCTRRVMTISVAVMISIVLVILFIEDNFFISSNVYNNAGALIHHNQNFARSLPSSDSHLKNASKTTKTITANAASAVASNQNCARGRGERYRLILHCTKCSANEMRAVNNAASAISSSSSFSQLANVCARTGFKQRVRCVESNAFDWVSCGGDQKEQLLHYFLFQGAAALCLLGSCAVVLRRRRHLNLSLARHVSRQIGGSSTTQHVATAAAAADDVNDDNDGEGERAANEAESMFSDFGGCSSAEGVTGMDGRQSGVSSGDLRLHHEQQQKKQKPIRGQHHHPNPLSHPHPEKQPLMLGSDV